MAKIPRQAMLDRLEQPASRLPPVEHEIYILCARERLRYGEVADRLGISVEEVKRRLADALYRLDRDIEPQARPWWKFW